MRTSLRKALEDSHVAAATITLLLFLSLRSILQALPRPLIAAFEFVAMTVAVRGVPYHSHQLDFADKAMLINTVDLLYNALILFLSAWLLSRWVYGMTPLRVLSGYWSRFSRRENE